MSEQHEVSEAHSQDASSPSPRRNGNRRFVAIAGLIVVGGLLAWWLFARAGGETATTAVPERGSAMLPGVERSVGPVGPTVAVPGAAAPNLPGLDVMADKLAKRLEQDPMDGEGWALLARTYLELGATAKADAAYAKALALRPGDASMKADYTAARKALQSRQP